MSKIGGMFLLLAFIGPWAWAEEAPVAASTVMSALRAQMEMERAKEQELQLLRLEVDRLKLEVEKKKAVVELGKMEAPVRNGSSVASDGRSSVLLRYVFMAAGRKEAVLDVDGIEQRVKEGSAVGDQVVQEISAEGLSLKTKDGSRSFLSRLP